MLDGTRVHGYITEGGVAVNIIPERAACEFSVRGKTAADMERTRAIVERCAKAAAMASDVEVTIERRGGYRGYGAANAPFRIAAQKSQGTSRITSTRAS